MKILGREIRWSEQPIERRSEITDIDVAFAAAQLAATGADNLAIPAVYRSGQILSDLAGSLPMEAIGSTGIADPMTPELLEQPDKTLTYHSVIASIVLCLVHRGNAYLRPILRDRIGNVRSIQVLNPDEVSVGWDRPQLHREYAWRGKRLEANREIYHIPINLMPGALKGIGPIEAARLMYEGIHAEANMQRRLFEDNATPSGTLNVQRPLTKTEAEELLERWENTHAGRQRPAVLSGGATFNPITINPVDAQFIEARGFSVQEVARMFGLPGFFLLVDSGSSLTYSTTESLFRLFLTMTLNPTYLEPIEQTFSLMLPSSTRARFRSDEILKADIEARYRAYEIGISSGFLLQEEVRNEERLPRIDPSRLPTPQPAPRGPRVPSGSQ